MIITKLIGGLGNQLFQYALGEHLSRINNTYHLLDISGFEEYKLHRYSLNHFNIKAAICSKKILKKIKYPSILSKVFKITILINEKNYLFDASILQKRINKFIYLNGYWQSEKYFLAIEHPIREEFKLSTELNSEDKLVLNKIKQSNSICLHTRRGDYVNNSVTNRVHGTCDINYYTKAIQMIENKVTSPIFFLFSDDIEWCKANFQINSPTIFVSHNTAERNFADLYLMSRCKHNIIANSSFSWWGAWLNNNSEKIVVAPQKWFAVTETNKQTEDLIPDKWIRI